MLKYLINYAQQWLLSIDLTNQTVPTLHSQTVGNN